MDKCPRHRHNLTNWKEWGSFGNKTEIGEVRIRGEESQVEVGSF